MQGAEWLQRLHACHGPWFRASRKRGEGTAPCHAGLSATYATLLEIDHSGELVHAKQMNDQPPAMQSSACAHFLHLCHFRTQLPLTCASQSGKANGGKILTADLATTSSAMILCKYRPSCNEALSSDGTSTDLIYALLVLPGDIRWRRQQRLHLPALAAAGHYTPPAPHHTLTGHASQI